MIDADDDASHLRAVPQHAGRSALQAIVLSLLSACALSEPLSPDELPDEGNWVSVSAGRDHTCALDTGGRAYCWGSNGDGQLGRAGGDTVCGPFNVPCHRTPAPVDTPLRFRTLSAGVSHTCGVTTSGQAYCWGDNSSGALGNEGPTGPTPLRVPVDAVRAVSAGDGHSCAIRIDAAAFCWGANDRGQLGTGSRDASPLPVRVELQQAIASISAGPRRTCARTTSNVAYCWGAVWMFRQDGLEYTKNVLLPRMVPQAPPTTALSVGEFATCAITVSETAVCWEANPYGQLGTGGLDGSTIPLPVASTLRFTSVSASIIHTCGITTTGEAYCWGDDTFGELGVAGTALTERCSGNVCSTVPVAVDGGQRFRSISAGFGNHTCGVTDRRALYCWGLGIWGQRGDGTTDYVSPVPLLARAPEVNR